ncbi:MAG: 2Fe-2S iron-sulfur cluster-binding protein, partial [Tissierellaceae bacterium]
MRYVTLTIDGQKVTVPEDYNVLEAAKEAGIDVPALCYDPNLEVVGACRLCLVEIEGSRKLETS